MPPSCEIGLLDMFVIQFTVEKFGMLFVLTERGRTNLY